MLDLSTEIIFGLVGGLMLLQVYQSYFRTNDVSQVDLMDLYCRNALNKRYGSKKYEET